MPNFSAVTSMGQAPETHPKKSEAKILFTSVFGPYAQDDEYGSRKINPMELYHNQVTRFQGPFSLRMFHGSWGLKMIQHNITAPSALLDFPTRDRFIEELKTQKYDIIAISAILPNLLKVKDMCELIREIQPEAKIIIGGHIANMDGLDKRIDADHIVKGEGIQWFRSYLGEDPKKKFIHPPIVSGLKTKTMGLPVPCKPADVAATLIPSVGCPLGCNFCSTSAMFGGKGKFFNFFETGDEIYEVMCKLEEEMGVKSFFCMDENFLFHKKRAMRLLELMERDNKAWALYVFSSANVLALYTIDELIRLGISWVWIGMEGKDSSYEKRHGTDLESMVKELQANGIRLLGSTIIGLEEHTNENIDEVIDHAVEFNTEFHQFMLYTPLPGTPLFKEHLAAGTLIDPECKDTSDTHGQHKFFHKHPNIKNGEEEEYLKRAFVRDFEVNGPSVLRVVRTTLNGWKMHKNHPSERVRSRYQYEADGLDSSLAGVVWAARKWYKNDPKVYKLLNELLQDLYKEFGLKTRILAPLIGMVAYVALWRENRLQSVPGRYEPDTRYERLNWK